MHEPTGVEPEVVWSQEGDAWVGVLGRWDHASQDAAWAGRDGFEVELLLRATDWHVEVSHDASGGFCREHIQAADAEEAKAKAADLLHAFKAKVEGPIESDLTP
jgi:hypothetical protein